MAKRYALTGQATTAASATLPLMTVMGATTARPKIYDIIVGSAATPADNAAKFQIQRCTTAGTAGSALTPQALDAADPASVVTSGLAIFSVGPTLTANAFLLQWSQNQRATFRWVAAPGSELVIPATAANGLALMSPSGAAIAYDITIEFEE